MLKYPVLFVAGFMLLFISCKNEIDDIFPESANARVKQTMAKCDEMLKSSSEGWRMDYTPKHGSELNFVMKFDQQNDSVYMYVNTEKSSWSRYNMYAGEGPLLSFDTYSVLHYYADPGVTDKDVTSDGELKDGTGFGGDFEFVINTISEDTIVLRGRKNHDIVKMYRIKAGEINRIRLARKLQEKYRDTRSFFNILQSSSTMADIKMGDDNNNITVITGTEENPLSKEVALTYTEEGFVLATPVDLNGSMIQTFKWNELLKTFVGENNTRVLESNFTIYPWGDTVKLLEGHVYDVEKVSPGTLVDWYASFLSAYSDFLQTQFYFNALRTDGKLENCFSFVLGDGSEMTWNNMLISDSNISRKDRITLTRGGTEGPKAREILRNVIGKRIIDTVFDTEGFTVIVNGDLIYLVSIRDATKWFMLKESTNQNTNIK